VTDWDIGGAMPPRMLRSHTWIVEAVGWSPDGQYFASCGLDGVLYLWDATSHTVVQRFENARLLLLSMAWSLNGKQLACGTYGRGIQVWDEATRSLHFVEQTGRTAFWAVAWSPNGTQLVGGSDDGCLYLWEYKQWCRQAQDTGQEQGPVPTRLPGGHQSRTTSVAWSPDGRWLASGSGTTSKGELFLWDVLTEERVPTFGDHPDMVYALTWSRSPHGDQLISAGGDGLLRWWDVERAVCIMTRQAHQGTIRSLKVSPDGKFLASCGDDGAIKIWDRTSHELLRTLRHDRPYERMNITGLRGVTEAQKETLRALGAVEDVPGNRP
jgi:WD40 repeat protein